MEQGSPFVDLADALWREAGAAGRPLGLLIAELDGFSAYVDFHGPVAAETCAHGVLCCLREQLRGESDRIGALGGALSAALLPGAGASDAGEVGERLRVAVAGLALPHLGLTPVGIMTISVGVASLSQGAGRGVAELFDAADRAVRAARRAGGDCVRIAVDAVSSGPMAAARLI